MENILDNVLGTERTVEVKFLSEIIPAYCANGERIIDVGGIPSRDLDMAGYYEKIRENQYDYRISDFRGGDYPGDFVTYDFSDTVFDSLIFLSSLEHFPQCTESDKVFRSGYDRLGFLKAMDILKPGGFIFLTVPMGKHVWQNYHQNYNWEGILKLTKGSLILEHYIYTLNPEKTTWTRATEPYDIDHILYTDYDRGAECVGCFVIQKPF